jgi:hypothetical protein
MLHVQVQVWRSPIGALQQFSQFAVPLFKSLDSLAGGEENR